MVSSNPCDGYSHFLPSICADKILSTPKTTTFLPQLDLKKVNKIQIQYPILNKNSYLDPHF